MCYQLPPPYPRDPCTHAGRSIPLSSCLNRSRAPSMQNRYLGRRERPCRRGAPRGCASIAGPSCSLPPLTGTSSCPSPSPAKYTLRGLQAILEPSSVLNYPSLHRPCCRLTLTIRMSVCQYKRGEAVPAAPPEAAQAASGDAARPRIKDACHQYRCHSAEMPGQHIAHLTKLPFSV